MLEIVEIEEEHEKLRELKKIYRMLGPKNDILGPRQLFDKSEYREIYQTTKPPKIVGFLEGKLINSKMAIYLNIGFADIKYMISENINHVLNTQFDLPNLTKVTVISTHLKDDITRSILPTLGYEMIVSRPILLNYKLPTDGIHISYIKPI